MSTIYQLRVVCQTLLHTHTHLMLSLVSSSSLRFTLSGDVSHSVGSSTEGLNTTALEAVLLDLVLLLFLYIMVHHTLYILWLQSYWDVSNFDRFPSFPLIYLTLLENNYHKQDFQHCSFRTTYMVTAIGLITRWTRCG